MIAAGRLNHRAQFLRRAPVPVIAGELRGGFTNYGAPEWANFRPKDPQQIVVSGLALTVPTGTLMIRDSVWARTITSADRVKIADGVYEVRLVMPLERNAGGLLMSLVGVPDRSAYAAEMDQRGEVVLVKRGVAETNARAVVTGFTPEELVSGIDQGARKVILLAEDLEAASWPIPPKENDAIMVRGRRLNVEEVDASTHRLAGVLNAYEIVAVGAG